MYEYIRGSHLYGLNTPSSYIDTGGVFRCTTDELLGSVPCCDSARFGNHYRSHVSDAKSDNVWYEVGEYVRLVCKSNPNMLESLFVPEDKILVKPSAEIEPIFANRDLFVTKRCFAPFYSYSVAQIEKARGLNKKINNPITERKTPIDFCYTINGTGSEPLSALLDRNGMEPKYIGLQAVDHMHDVYLVYYDYSAHIIDKYGSYNKFKGSKLQLYLDSKGDHFYYVGEEKDETTMRDEFADLVHSLYGKPIGYRGIVSPNSDSNELRLSSIPKGEEPVCFICYNASGYTKHCREYKEYKKWEKNRNQARYESNLDKNYDSKNMSHAFRMVHMAREIADGEGVILDRSGIDRDFLMDIRNHKFEYDELIDMLSKEKVKMEESIKNSKIPSDIDFDAVNQVLIEIRKRTLNII